MVDQDGGLNGSLVLQTGNVKTGSVLLIQEVRYGNGSYRFTQDR